MGINDISLEIVSKMILEYKKSRTNTKEVYSLVINVYENCMSILFKTDQHKKKPYLTPFSHNIYFREYNYFVKKMRNSKIESILDEKID